MKNKTNIDELLLLVPKEKREFTRGIKAEHGVPESKYFFALIEVAMKNQKIHEQALKIAKGKKETTK